MLSSTPTRPKPVRSATIATGGNASCNSCGTLKAKIERLEDELTDKKREIISLSVLNNELKLKVKGAEEIMAEMKGAMEKKNVEWPTKKQLNHRKLHSVGEPKKRRKKAREEPAKTVDTASTVNGDDDEYDYLPDTIEELEFEEHELETEEGEDSAVMIKEEQMYDDVEETESDIVMVEGETVEVLPLSYEDSSSLKVPSKLVDQSLLSPSQQRKKARRDPKKRPDPSPDAKHKTYCKVCGDSFANRALLLSHESTTGHDKRYTCPYCNWGFKQKIQMTRHIEQSHDMGDDYECKLCGRKFKNEWSCRRHEANVELHSRMARPIQECYVCGKKLARRNSWAMNQHIKSHTREELAKAEGKKMHTDG